MYSTLHFDLRNIASKISLFSKYLYNLPESEFVKILSKDKKMCCEAHLNYITDSIFGNISGCLVKLK